jgi:hypothetical protein
VSKYFTRWEGGKGGGDKRRNENNYLVRKEKKSCREPMAYLVFIHITKMNKVENEGRK